MLPRLRSRAIGDADTALWREVGTEVRTCQDFARQAIFISPPEASAYSLSTLSGSALIGRASRVSTLVPISEAATCQILKSR